MDLNLITRQLSRVSHYLGLASFELHAIPRDNSNILCDSHTLQVLQPQRLQEYARMSLWKGDGEA